jgi:hypothetical protein
VKKCHPTQVAFLCLALLVVLSGSSLAQITFERTYGGVLEERGWYVSQTTDGGYVITGATVSFGHGMDDIYLIKTDSLGDTLWTNTYGGTEHEFGCCVQQTGDGGYIVVGSTGSIPGRNLYLVRTDSLGTMLWQKDYGGTYEDVGRFVKATRDGGFVTVGWSEVGGQCDLYMMRTDSLGEALWERTYHRGNNDDGFAVDETPDGGFMVSGWAGDLGGTGDVDFYLLRTDSVGNKLWDATYGGDDDDFGQTGQLAEDRGYILVGLTRSFDNGDVYLVRTDSLGQMSWSKTYGGSANDYGRQVQQTHDGGCIVAGYTESFGAGGLDVYAVRTDPNGNMLWDTTFGGPGWDEARSVQQTQDGGYILAGTTQDSTGDWQVYVIKICRPITPDAGVTSLGPPPDTVFCDSTYAVKALVTNFGDVFGTFEVVAALDGYGDTVQVEGVPPDSSTEVAFEDWQVPSSDSMFYTMTVCTHIWADSNSANDCAQKDILARCLLHDGGVVSLDLPRDTVIGDSVYTPVATIGNFGDYPETLFAFATINGYVDSVEVADVPPGELKLVAFTDWYVPNIESTYTMTVCAYVAIDSDPTNDCGQKSIFVYMGLPEQGIHRPHALTFGLAENLPNPFHRSTVISYSLPQATEVTLTICDITGRLVETLVDETQQPGMHQVRWNRKDNPNGVYFYSLRAGDYVETRKMVAVG